MLTLETWLSQFQTVAYFGSLVPGSRGFAPRIRYPKDMNLEELFRSVVNQAGVKTVFGDPISANGKTIVPVAKVRCGFGGGSGRKEQDNEEGFGGGGGFLGKPVGVIEITNEKTRFVPISSNWPIVAAVAIGVCLGMLIGPKPVHVRVEKKRDQPNL